MIQVYLVIGAIQRRQGKWQESTANLEKAVSLNPNETWPLQNLYFNYQMQRNFAAANRVVDRALAINPQSFSFWGSKASLAFAERGDLTVAEKGLALLDQEIASGKVKQLDPETKAEIALAKAGVFMLRAKYQEVLDILGQLPPETLAAKPSGAIEASLLEGRAYEKLGQTTEARAAYLKAKETAQAAVREAPEKASRHADLARVLAHLGEKDSAIAEGKRATEMLPVSIDAFEGPMIAEALAEVYALTGEHAKAIAQLDELLSRPGDLTVPLLR